MNEKKPGGSSFIVHRSSFDSEAYEAFAYAYDKALGEPFFRAVRRLLLDTLDRYPSPDKTHLDVACGTALAMEFFEKRGWRSTGVDASMPMLRIARSRGRRLIAGDFRSLPVRGAFARITCLYDSLNHLQSRGDLIATFRSVRRLMSSESLFLFDVNRADVYPGIWGTKEPFVASGPDYHLEMATVFRTRDRLGRARVTGWAVLPSGERIEIDETHQQRAWDEREIADALQQTGLAPLEVVDFDPFEEGELAGARSAKLFYICSAAGGTTFPR